MPTGVIKGPESEAMWNRAKEVAKEQYPGLKSKDKNKFYAIVMTIYKNMCTKHNCTPKSESDMSMILNRLELFESLDESISDFLPKNYIDWQLHEPLNNNERKIINEAARDLNSGIKTSIRELKKWMESVNINIYEKDGMSEVGNKLSEVWNNNLKPVIENKRYKSTGISDAEPMYEAAQRLISFIKEYYGLTGWTDLGDYIN